MNEYQQYGSPQQPQFGPQSLFGGMFGAPLGGAIGRGLGGIFGDPNLGGRIGEIAGGIGGSLLPFGADPIAAQQQQLQQQLQQQQQQQQQLQQLQQLQRMQQLQPQQGGQLAPQGWFGGLVNQFSKPLGNIIGSATQNPALGNVIGGVLPGIANLLPFNVSPNQLQQMQQQPPQQAGQLAPQSWLSGLGGLVNQFSNPIASTVADAFGAPSLAPVFSSGLNALTGLLPQSVDAQGGGQQGIVQQLKHLQVQQQQLQQALQQVQQQAMLLQQQLGGQQPQAQGQGQMAPQGWLGNMVSQYAQPVGSFLGSQFGNQGIGNAAGTLAGQLGRYLPFAADPLAAYQAQQALAGQQTVH